MALANNVQKGIGVSTGYGIGRALVLGDNVLDYSLSKFTNAKCELERLDNAIKEFEHSTSLMIERLKKSATTKEAEILQGHIVMLNDPFMRSQMNDIINSNCVAEKAVDSVCSMYVDMFSASSDELTRQRASDVGDIRDRLIAILLGVDSVDLSNVPPNTILVAKDLTPSMTSKINSKNVSAIVTEVGGITSHSAILARAMGIPAVLSLNNATNRINNGEMLIVDGFRGNVIFSPSDSDLEHYTSLNNKFLEERESLLDYFSKPVVASNGVTKHVLGNITKSDDAQSVLQNGGEGVGLFRSEFLFMHRDNTPTQQEQYEAYSTVAKALDGREVTIRTLDIGGDKAIDYLSIEREDNPFLGHRGIRYCLDNIALFKCQIKAILRSAVFGDVRILLPFVTTVEDVKNAKEIIFDCEMELKKEGVPFSKAPIGVMIETPSSAIISDLLARECDFFSIGTNDLTGYIMSADRGNSNVAGYYDTMSTAVLRMIELTIRNAKMNNIPVAMCGEAASNSRLIPLLVKWGLDDFSVTPSLILQTKKNICTLA